MSSHKVDDAAAEETVELDAGPAEDEPSLEPRVDLGDEDPDYLFDPDVVRTFELRLNEDDLAFLDQDPKAEQYVPGELVFEGQRIGPVGIRYKGSSGSFVGCLSGNFFPATGSKTCAKLGMKIKIDYGDPEAKFYGQKKLVFHAMNLDRSLMRERLGYGLFREMGVHASRTVHVRLLINGQLSGLYLLVEEIDGRFTRSRFEDGGRGNLYKEVWPLHDKAGPYLAALETNRDEHPQVDKMLAFAQALNAADDQALPSVVESWMDADYTARFVAVDRAIRHDDGPFHWYCQPAMGTGGNEWIRQREYGDFLCGNHNFYWYEESEAERIWPVPWDLDNAMASFEGFTTVRSAWDDLSNACSGVIPAVGFGIAQMPITCDPLQRAWALGLHDRVRAALRELLDGPFSEQATNDKLATWSAQIEEVVEEASTLNPREPNLTMWATEIETLKTTLARLRTEAEAAAAREPTEVVPLPK